MKKTVLILICVLLGVSVLASCSAKGGAIADSARSDSDYGYGVPEQSAENPAGENSTKKLIKRYNVSAETKEYDKTSSLLDQAVNEAGGYFERRSEIKATANGARRLTATVRVPADKADGFLNDIRGISNVTSFEKSAEDVTSAYIDIEARLQTLEAEREGLLKMISSVDSAEQYEFWYKLHNAISEKEQDIAAYKAQLKNYDELASYSTLTLNLNEVKEYTEPEKEGFDVRLKKAFTESWEKFAEGFKDFTVFFVRSFPALLTFAVISGIIFLAIFLPIRVSRKRGKKANK